MNNQYIAVSIGDIKGIGIEILIKLWKLKKINNFILATNFILFDKYLKKTKIHLPLKIVNDKNNVDKLKKNNFLIFDYFAKNDIDNTFLSLKNCYNLVKKKHCSGIITLPLNKSKIINNIDKNFIGQTEYFEKIDKKKISNMIFFSKKIITSPLTNHIPIKNVHLFLKNKYYIYKKIILLNETLRLDFNIKNPKIAMSGINPHAGENKTISTEDDKFLKPTIIKLKKNKININGPFPADSLFSQNNIKHYDCFVCTYHDQALIPFKIISKFDGVNFTGSLDIVRLSPDHGTAYDLVGKNNANHNSLLNCFNFIKKIVKNRKKSN